MITLCRDCQHEMTERPRRCQNCHSPRLISHDELTTLSLAHIDCDAFYAAIEKRDHPEWRDKPLIVGGGTRGVVSTCCYIARTYGVRSAMPMFKALELCPNAVVVPPDMRKYSEIGHDLRERMEHLTPLVEPISIDEAFLDLSGTEKLHGAAPASILARFAREVEAECGITISIGLSYCKFLAKIASDIDKPRGFAVIGTKEAVTFLADKPIGILWGVGKVAQERLQKDGIVTVGDIQNMDEHTLLKRYGTEGQRLFHLAHGRDRRHVEPHRDMKSVSNETTFATDISDYDQLEAILFRLSEKVARRLRDHERAGRTVHLKLKTSDFKQRTRSRALPKPTRLATRIFETGRDLLKPECDGTHFRLIGIGVSELTSDRDADQMDLADTEVIKERATQEAIDLIRDRFGTDALMRGITFRATRDD
jgi:DNA polymerase IV